MDELLGHVDQFDKMLACGWAISKSDSRARPQIEFVQDGHVVISLTPSFEAPTLRRRLGLPAYSGRQLYAWRLWLPLAAGIEPDREVTIRFRETKKPLERGRSRTIGLIDRVDEGALEDLKQSVLFNYAVALSDEYLSIDVRLYTPEYFTTHISAMGKDIQIVEERKSTILGSPVTVCLARIRIPRSEAINSRTEIISVLSPPGDERRDFHADIRSLIIPRTALRDAETLVPIPNIDLIERVYGKNQAPITYYLMSGATTYWQIDGLARRFVGRKLSDLEIIVDWGVGCARVARCFWESTAEALTGELIGLDADDVSIDWCQRNMAPYGRYDLLPPTGFDLDANSVDLLYGSSMMTHLTEYNQLHWLKEVQRVLKPGGIAILTINGEYRIYRDPSSLALPFVDGFGFFDGIPDTTTGANRANHHRTAYHARSYIRQRWGEYFELLDIIPAANAMAQDFVVLRKQ